MIIHAAFLPHCSSRERCVEICKLPTCYGNAVETIDYCKLKDRIRRGRKYRISCVDRLQGTD
jgi:hypothetical protein